MVINTLIGDKHRLSNSLIMQVSFFIENDLNLVRETKQKFQQEHASLLQNLDDIEAMIRVASPKLRKSNDGNTWIDQTNMSKHENTNPCDLIKSSTSTTISTNVASKANKEHSSKNTREKSLDHATMTPPPKRQMRSHMSSATGIVARLATSNMPSTQQREQKSVRATNLSRLGSESVHESKEKNLEHHDTWRAPKDQDGSGITKLNAKFGGRY